MKLAELTAHWHLKWSLSLHYSDFIMGAMASQITSLATVYSIVYSGADQRKHQTPRQWPLWGEFIDDRWIPHTNITSNAENVSIWWRHHDPVDPCTSLWSAKGHSHGHERLPPISLFTVVKRTRVPAGYLVKMATDAASLRPGLCELWRPQNLQRDHRSCADTKKYK